MKRTRSRPNSLPSWRMASRNGRLSMSPTVPPISHSTKSSSPSRPATMNSLIASVMCGITCTVAPRYSPPLAADHGLIDAPGGDAVALARRHAGIAFVMTEIEIGLGAVIGDIDLAMLIGAHRARIDIEVGIELAQPHLEAARLHQRAHRRRRQTLAHGGN